MEGITMKHHVITINRMYGSNGRIIGRALAQKLGIGFYDQELISMASQKKDIPIEELRKVDETRASIWRYPVETEFQMDPQYHFYPMNNVLFEVQSEIIRSLAEKEDCVIVGRCANYLLGPDCLSVFIYAPVEFRIQTVINRLGREERSAKSLVRKMDRERRCYYEYFTDRSWLDMTQYDVCVNSARFSQEQIIDMLTVKYHNLK